MGLFDTVKKPVFLKKENRNMEDELNELKKLKPMLNEKGQELISRDIKFLEYGIIGEKNIIFELQNSGIPMYILHDIVLEYEGLKAQIDFLVFTKKLCFVIECKNLFGNIEINANGDFIRSMELNGKYKKEGIYSPITQNQRHMEIMKKIIISKKGNFFTKMMTERHFEDWYKGIVVLANPKTILICKNKRSEIFKKVIRADRLTEYIKDTVKKSNEAAMSENNMKKWAEGFLKSDIGNEVNTNYTKKYNAYIMSPESSDFNSMKEEIRNDINIEESNVFNELKKYRLFKSREEKIKPYYIYNDNQLKTLILKMPKNREELMQIPGFGEKKAEKYGNDIINILLKNKQL